VQVITRSPRRIWILAIVVVIGGAAFYWFGPWHLFVDRRVDEALPAGEVETVAPSDVIAHGDRGSAPSGEPPAPAIATLASGAFRSLAHTTSGTASIVELPDGRRFVRFEDLDTDSGPDLRVYLSQAPATGDASAIDDAFVDLGALKGNQGNQNYAIPDGVELDDIRSVSVWCRRFSVGFGVAPVVAG
jgi:hypothetical protein